MGRIPRSQGNRSEEQETVKGSQASTSLVRSNCRITMRFLGSFSLLVCLFKRASIMIRLGHSGVAEFPPSPHHKRVQEK